MRCRCRTVVGALAGEMDFVGVRRLCSRGPALTKTVILRDRQVVAGGALTRAHQRCNIAVVLQVGIGVGKAKVEHQTTGVGWTK